MGSRRGTKPFLVLAVVAAKLVVRDPETPCGKALVVACFRERALHETNTKLVDRVVQRQVRKPLEVVIVTR